MGQGVSSTGEATLGLGPSPSYAAVTGTIKVAVVPEGYPKVVLSIENISQLKDALLEEIVLSGWDSPIKFGRIHFWVGHLIVDCRNATSCNPQPEYDLPGGIDGRRLAIVTQHYHLLPQDRRQNNKVDHAIDQETN